MTEPNSERDPFEMEVEMHLAEFLPGPHFVHIREMIANRMKHVMDMKMATCMEEHEMKMNELEEMDALKENNEKLKDENVKLKKVMGEIKGFVR